MTKSITDVSSSGYKNEEDRVTATLLQILHYGGHQIIEWVFNDVIDLPSNVINVVPQVKENHSRPDGKVSCDCKYSIYIESKITKNALNTDQAQKQLDANRELHSVENSQWVIYITPDEERPEKLEGSEVIWTNWQTIKQRLEGYETTDTLILFLIQQFSLLIEQIVFNKRNIIDKNGILSKDVEDKVIIVGGRLGEEVALQYGFYACQPNRYFEFARYLAFYHQNRIRYVFKIEEVKEKVDINAVPNVKGSGFFKNKNDKYVKYMKLTLIYTCEPEIRNDKTDKNGKPCAFVQRQTYTSLEKIKNAKVTSDLEL